MAESGDQWLREFIDERRRLVHGCLELRADEVANWEFFLTELEKAWREARA